MVCCLDGATHSPRLLDLILIIATPEDVHGRIVRQHLHRLGHESVVLSPGDLGRGGTLSCSISDSAEAWRAAHVGARVDLQKVKAVWPRRFAEPRLPRELLGREDRGFARREWNHALDGMLETLDVPFMSPIASQRASVKPRQLSAARRAGLRIPATLFTSDATEALAFVEEHGGKVVLKAISPHRTQPMYTRRWQPRDERHLDKLKLVPAIFQEEINGQYDVRVTAVGSQIFAARARLDADTLDIRLRPDEPYESFSLPKETEGQIGRLMATLGLAFGCLDLRMTNDGEFVFFELNPQGQFLFIEIWTGLSISNAVAEFLAYRASSGKLRG